MFARKSVLKNHLSFHFQVACEQQTRFRSSLLSLRKIATLFFGAREATTRNASAVRRLSFRLSRLFFSKHGCVSSSDFASIVFIARLALSSLEFPFALVNSEAEIRHAVPWEGSFENEALENEDRSTKHPNLENEAPKIENEAPKTRKRSTQNSKTKHLKLENEAPKSRKRSTLSRKRSTQKSRHRSVLYKHETNVNTAEIKRHNEYSITNRMQFKSTQAPKTRKRSTQSSKTKHPKLENEAPKMENLLLLFLLLLFLKGSRKENYAQLLASVVGFRNRELPVPFCQK